MTAPETGTVMRALTADGGAARFVGGAVRNALMHRPVTDIDIATPLLPDEVTRRLQAAGLGAVPTGIEHGTVTAIANGKPYEITTLRRDVTTDGRRATVAFTNDWKEDASRRDFTMNALYASGDGEVFDFFGGIADLQAGRVRFVGDPVTRILEDYLRILRLFRFHAWYGSGDIDADALHAATHEKAGLAKLSGERIQKELLRLLKADNSTAMIRAMVDSGILAEILPVEPNSSRLENLISTDRAHGYATDPLLRLAAMLPDDAAAAEAVAARLKLSNNDAERLRDLCGATEYIGAALSPRETRALLYRLGTQRFKDRAHLRWAASSDSNAAPWQALLEAADHWRRPTFPLRGHDVIALGLDPGPQIGRLLSEVEKWWIESDFKPDRAALLAHLKAIAADSGH
ncbi:MAG: CCA tRNA nucleotidyltransferase [Alphaproteobacteria bacterium]|nr:CCA tRNA nucleotidyltransferase [Alphaproteobacteria bacterium]